jgi:hypothetical protein
MAIIPSSESDFWFISVVGTVNRHKRYFQINAAPKAPSCIHQLRLALIQQSLFKKIWNIIYNFSKLHLETDCLFLHKNRISFVISINTTVLITTVNSKNIFLKH